MKKRLILTLVVVAAFFAGYGGMVLAYPGNGVHDRAANRGYFTNSLDGGGWEVLNRSCANSGEFGPYNYNNLNNWCNAVPRDLNDTGELKSFIRGRLANGVPNGSHGFGSGSYGDTRARTGAAFIVNTMLGKSIPDRQQSPSAAMLAEWEGRIDEYANAGLISWSENYNFNINSYFQGTDNSPSPNDDAFFDESNDGLAIIFRNLSGGIEYVLRRECGNPVGYDGVGDLTPLQDFTVTGFTTVNGSTSDITVNPGAAVQFRHYVRNDGPTSTNPTPISWVAQNMPSQAAVGGPLSSGTYFAGEQKEVLVEPGFTVPNGTPAGTQYCRRVGWDPVNDNGVRDGRGATRCATVAQAYNLVPVVSAPTGLTAQDGDTVTFNFTIDNTGTNDSPSVNCSISGTQPAGIPGPPGTSCPRVFIWNDPAPTQVATQSFTVSGQPPGSQICRTLTVNPASATVPSRPSAQVCVTIVKTPYVHFMGGDVWAGGGFEQANGTCTTNNARITTSSRPLGGTDYAGSSVEYAAYALGAITRFGSASKALVQGAPAGPTTLARALTFSNTNAVPGNLAAPQHCINNYYADYATVTQTCPATVNVGAAPANPCRRTGDLAITGGTMPGGSQQIYLVTGNVNITGNINYPATYTSVSNIPSLIVIANGQIRVNGSVTNLNGMYVSGGTFFTCQEKPPLPTATCNTSLSLDGAVIARYLDLYRTAGAEGATVTQRQTPAETIKLAPEIFLRNALNPNTTSVIRTSQLRELPPRF